MRNVQHFNHHARKAVPPNEHVLLLVDGHSSRKGEAWLQACEKLGILVVKLLDSTTHLLQPCDQPVDKICQKAVRSTTNELLLMIRLSWANLALKIKLAVAGYRAITADFARKSFRGAGLWPMNFRFVERTSPSQDSDNMPT